MQKMIYVDPHMETLIAKVSSVTKTPFSSVVKAALILWLEKHTDETHKDPIELLYEAIELLKRK